MGPSGQATRLMYMGMISETGSMRSETFPEEVGNAVEPPTLNCYFSDTMLGPYYQFGTGVDGDTRECLLVRDHVGWHARMNGVMDAPWGVFVVIY